MFDTKPHLHEMNNQHGEMVTLRNLVLRSSRPATHKKRKKIQETSATKRYCDKNNGTKGKAANVSHEARYLSLNSPSFTTLSSTL